MRFYGGSLSDWLSQPVWLVSKFVEAMPALAAEEQLIQINITAAGSGSMKKEEHRNFISSIRAELPQPETPKRKGLDQAELASMGVGVRYV